MYPEGHEAHWRLDGINENYRAFQHEIREDITETLREANISVHHKKLDVCTRDLAGLYRAMFYALDQHGAKLKERRALLADSAASEEAKAGAKMAVDLCYQANAQVACAVEDRFRELLPEEAGGALGEQVSKKLLGRVVRRVMDHYNRERNDIDLHTPRFPRNYRSVASGQLQV